MTVQEPRFTPAETALLLAARRKALAPRGSHGILMSEATDPANMGKFTVPEPVTDFAAKALFEAREKVRVSHGAEAADNYLLLHVEKKA